MEKLKNAQLFIQQFIHHIYESIKIFPCLPPYKTYQISFSMTIYR